MAIANGINSFLTKQCHSSSMNECITGKRIASDSFSYYIIFSFSSVLYINFELF